MVLLHSIAAKCVFCKAGWEPYRMKWSAVTLSCLYMWHGACFLPSLQHLRPR